MTVGRQYLTWLALYDSRRLPKLFLQSLETHSDTAGYTRIEFSVRVMRLVNSDMYTDRRGF